MNKYLAVNRIEFAVTYLCNSKCRHCQLDEEKMRFPNHIDKSIGAEIVKKVSVKHRPKSVMTFGGEPLLCPAVVCAIHKEAMRAGIPIRDVITNGFWSRNEGEISKIAKNLAESGVNEAAISVDVFHQEFIPLEIVKKAAQSLLEAGVPHVRWNPCWVVSADDDNQFNRKTRAVLQKLKDLPMGTSEGNVAQPEGRAVSNLANFLPSKTRAPIGKCGDMPYTERLDSVETIFVEPDGGISVCKEFYIGNAFKTDVNDVIEDYDPYKIPAAKALIEEGMEGLIRWARSLGVHLNSEGYYNICDMCTDLRRRARKAR